MQKGVKSIRERGNDTAEFFVCLLIITISDPLADQKRQGIGS